MFCLSFVVKWKCLLSNIQGIVLPILIPLFMKYPLNYNNLKDNLFTVGLITFLDFGKRYGMYVDI